MANSATRKLIIEEAKRRGWETQEIGPNAHFIKVIHPDGRSNVLRGSQPRQNSALSFIATKDKSLALDFVSSYGYQVPPYLCISNQQQAANFLAEHGKIVLKPIDSLQSQGVTVNITDPAQIEQAFAEAMKFSSNGRAIVQKHLDGSLYRITMIDGKMVAATWRTAITVTGDGERTTAELIAALNTDPRRGEGADLGLKKIDHATAGDHIGEDAMQRVPAAHEVVTISSMDSAPGGGAVNVTNRVHADWQAFSKHMADELGLFISGFDFICPDISQPLNGNNVPLLEINGAPGMRIHNFPTVGEPIDLAPLLLDALFPEL